MCGFVARNVDRCAAAIFLEAEVERTARGRREDSALMTQRGFIIECAVAGEWCSSGLCGSGRREFLNSLRSYWGGVGALASPAADERYASIPAQRECGMKPSGTFRESENCPEMVVMQERSWGPRKERRGANLTAAQLR
jgi:hypothetical protein